MANRTNLDGRRFDFEKSAAAKLARASAGTFVRLLLVAQIDEGAKCRVWFSDQAYKVDFVTMPFAKLGKPSEFKSAVASQRHAFVRHGTELAPRSRITDLWRAEVSSAVQAGKLLAENLENYRIAK